MAAENREEREAVNHSIPSVSSLSIVSSGPFPALMFILISIGKGKEGDEDE